MGKSSLFSTVDLGCVRHEILLKLWEQGRRREVRQVLQHVWLLPLGVGGACALRAAELITFLLLLLVLFLDRAPAVVSPPDP
ncbi:hypothetical protein TIFTF001_013072 [Ficus carica]|uniref:Uncharacterized protein n=1 Tax=Ficus carica TaxID=3494 RepID=A0AA87ZU96_FICCA|nr:hypothetical protein TIFTF001_013072 [Ficus carica]